MDALDQKSWFLDQKGNIEGPLSTRQVILGLIGKKYKVIHRVSRDRQNWKAICNEDHFEQAIHFVINNVSSETEKFANVDTNSDIDEKTGFGDLGNISESISDQLNHAQALQEINVNLNSLRKLLQEIQAKKKMVMNVSAPEREALHEDDQSVFIHESSAEEKKPFWVQYRASIIIVLAGVSFLGLLKYLEFVTDQEVEQFVKKADVGSGGASIEDYEGLSKNGDYNTEELLRMAQQEMGDKNLGQIEKLLEKAVDVAKGSQEKSKAEAMLGYVALRRKNVSKATGAYERAMRHSPNIFLTLHNYGVLMLRKKNYEKAEELLLAAMKVEEGPKDRSTTIFALLGAALELDKRDIAERQADPKRALPKGSIQKLERVDKVIPLFAKISKAYTRELNLAWLHIQNLQRVKRLNNNLMLEFLKVEDEKLPERIQMAGLDTTHMQWTQLYEWCLDVYKRDRRAPVLNAIFGYCLWKSKGAKEALPYFTYAAQRSKGNRLFAEYEDKVAADVRSPATGKSPM